MRPANCLQGLDSFQHNLAVEHIGPVDSIPLA